MNFDHVIVIAILALDKVNKTFNNNRNLFVCSYEFPQGGCSTLYALIASTLPSGHITVTLNILTFASGAYTGGLTFTILQIASSNFVSSEIQLTFYIGKSIRTVLFIN